MVVNNSKNNYYRFFTFDTIDGSDKQYLDVESHTTTLTLNAAGEIDITLSSPRKGSAAWKKQQAITLPKKRSLGADFRGTILEAGPIQKRKPDTSGRNTKIVAKGIWALLQERIIFSNGNTFPNNRPADDVVEFTNTTPQNIMMSIVSGTIASGIPGASLPITLPGVTTAGSTSRKYEGFKMVKVGAELDKLSNTDSGCDVRFRPEYFETGINWRMELGSPLLDNLSGTRPVFDLTVPSTPVISFTADEDGSNIVSRTFVPGNGSGKDMAMGWASTTKLTDQRYPFTESSNSSKHDADTAVLQDEAALNLKEATANWKQWTLTVRPDATPIAGSYLPGDFADLYVGDNYPGVDAGYYVVRIMQIVFNDSDVTITMSPLEGTGAIDPNSVPRHFAAGYSYHAATLDERLAALENYGADKISLTGADGSGLVWTPDTGLSSVDSLGNSAPFDPSAPSSGSGDIELGSVTDYTVSSKIAMVTVEDGSTRSCSNWWDEDKTLFVGDKVVVSQNKKDSQFGVTQRYGKGPATRNFMPTGKVWIDSGNVMGYGAGMVIGFIPYNGSSSGNKWVVYDPNADVVSDLVMPAGYETKVNGIYVMGTAVYASVASRTVYYKGNTNYPSSNVLLFYKWDKTTKTWGVVSTGSAMSALTDDDWATSSDASNNRSGWGSVTFAPPAFATAKYDTAVASGSMYRWNVIVTVWRMKSDGTFENTSGEFNTYRLETTNAAPSGPPDMQAVVGGDHAYILLANSFNYIGFASGISKNLNFKETTGGATPTALDTWFGTSGTSSLYPCRVSSDSKIYMLAQNTKGQAVIFSRSNSDTAAVQTVVASAIVDTGMITDGYVQRDGTSSDYYMAAHVYTVYNGTVTGKRGTFIKVDINGNVTTLVPPVAGNYDRTGDAMVFDVTQLPDGSFVTSLETASTPMTNGSPGKNGTYTLYQYKAGNIVKFTHT